MRSMSREQTRAVEDAACVEPCPECAGACADPRAKLTQADCQWLGNRLDRMYTARPDRAPLPHQLAHGEHGSGEVEWAQLLAFEAGAERWWEVMPEDLVFEEDGGEAGCANGLHTGCAIDTGVRSELPP